MTLNYKRTSRNLLKGEGRSHFLAFYSLHLSDILRKSTAQRLCSSAKDCWVFLNTFTGGSLCSKLGLETEFGNSDTGQIYWRTLQAY